MDKIIVTPRKVAQSLTPVRPTATSLPDRTATLNEKKNGKHKTSRQDWRHIARHQDAWDDVPSFERMR